MQSIESMVITLYAKYIKIEVGMTKIGKFVSNRSKSPSFKNIGQLAEKGVYSKVFTKK